MIPAQIANLFAVAIGTTTLLVTQPDVGGNITISGITAAGQTVRLWMSTDLSAGALGWTQVQTTNADTGGVFSFNVSKGADTKAFYRVK